MKTRGWIDFYLPRRIAYHLKIVLGAVFITMFFNLLWANTLINDNFLIMLIVVIVQLEIFMLIALRIFNEKRINKGKPYKKQIIIKLVVFYITVMAIAFAMVFITISFSMISGDQNFSGLIDQFVRDELKGLLISWLIGITIGSLVFFYMEWNNALKREQKLREEKLIFQYETLKNQVNPHFLFNSLNTLSSLISKDAQLSEKFISKFSSNYRYILENRDKDFVALSKEIDFVRDYFFLQKIRDDGKIILDIEIDDPEKYEILPISVQLLVENALKHNAATKANPLVIKIYLEDDHLYVTNSMQPKTLLEPSSKTGLKNLKERVKLAMNKKVDVKSSSSQFVVKMPLKSI